MHKSQASGGSVFFGGLVSSTSASPSSSDSPSSASLSSPSGSLSSDSPSSPSDSPSSTSHSSSPSFASSSKVRGARSRNGGSGERLKSISHVPSGQDAYSEPIFELASLGYEKFDFLQVFGPGSLPHHRKGVQGHNTASIQMLYEYEKGQSHFV